MLSAMRANLHLHSRFSDGTIWPEEIIARAAAAKLKTVALTDHDTIAGTREFAEAGARSGIATIPGVEIDCREPSLGYKSELLAYFPAGRYAWTAAFLDEIKKERIRSMRGAIALAAEVFNNPRLRFSALTARKRAERTKLHADDFSYNKVDVYQYLKDEGAVDPAMDYKTFKKTFFDSRVLSNGSREKPLCADVAGTVAKDGGIVVVPHIGHEFGDDPDRLKREKTRLGEILEFFSSIGAAGIELYLYRDDKDGAVNQIVKKAAKPFGFFFTYGSDCHGPGSGKDTIAAFSGNFRGFPKA